MKPSAYIKVFRDIQAASFYNDSKAVHLWLHLACEARFLPGKVPVDGDLVKLEVGDVIVVKSDIATSLGWHRDTVAAKLAKLVAAGGIKVIRQLAKYEIVRVSVHNGSAPGANDSALGANDSAPGANDSAGDEYNHSGTKDLRLRKNEKNEKNEEKGENGGPGSTLGPQSKPPSEPSNAGAEPLHPGTPGVAGDEARSAGSSQVEEGCSASPCPTRMVIRDDTCSAVLASPWVDMGKGAPPAPYHRYSHKSFLTQAITQLDQALKTGASLALTGAAGVGKSCFLTAYWDGRWKAGDITFSPELPGETYYASFSQIGADLCSKAKGFRGEELDSMCKEIARRESRTAKHLILDDVGNEALPGFQREEVARVILARAAAGLQTIITTRLSTPELITLFSVKNIDSVAIAKFFTAATWFQVIGDNKQNPPVKTTQSAG